MSDLLNSASLVLIPSGYAEDKVYSAVPTDGSGDLSFTRSSNGTRINSAGLVEVVPWNAMQYSEDFTNAVYNKYNNITATADQTTAPNGTTTADKIGLSTASTTFPNLGQENNWVNGQVYTFSVYLKKNTINFGKIRVGGTAFASSTNSPLFNLNTGVLVSGTGTIESIGNGWYRCTMTATAEANSTGSFAIDLPDSAGVWNGSSVYNVNDSIFAWGYQANIGSTAKPYFPTTDRLNVPRLTYQNGGGGCPSLLLEKQSTNLFAQSNNFTSVGDWYIYKDSGSTFTQTSNYGISPDGTQNATRLQANITAGVYANYARYFNITIGTTYTYSIYIKSLSGTPTIRFVTPNGSAQSITLTTNWERYTYTFTASSADFYGNFYIESPTSLSYDLLTYGAQLEASSYPTSYISTTSASATRLLDECTKTGISSLIGQQQGTLFFDLNPSDFFDPSYVGINGVTRFIVGFEGDSGNTGTLRTYGIWNTSLGTFSRYQRLKIAMAYKNNDLAIYINGALVTSSTSVTFTGDFSVFSFANNVGSQYFKGNINQAALFTTRLTNAELASLTTL